MSGRATHRQIRDANRLMLADGFCYLRLFANRHRYLVSPALGANPTVDSLLRFVADHTAWRRHDSFVCCRISGPFRAHIYRARYSNPWLAQLRHLSGDMPVTIGSPWARPERTTTNDRECQFCLAPYRYVPVSWYNSKLYCQRACQSLAQDTLDRYDDEEGPDMTIAAAPAPQPTRYNRAPPPPTTT